MNKRRMINKDVVRHVIFVKGREGEGEREKIQKVTALKLHRQCPLVLLVKKILEAMVGHREE